jgi:hypothetical protein
MDSIVTPMMIDQGMELTDDMEVDESNGNESNSGKRRRNRTEIDGSAIRALESHIKIALSLYKVQQNIYLLDFQRIEVS